MFPVTRRTPLPWAIIGLATFGALVLGVIEAREFRESIQEERLYQTREVQEGLSSLHRDLQMVSHLTGGHGRPSEAETMEYLTARRDLLGPIRWLGAVHAAGERPHVLLASAEMRGYDPRRDNAVAPLLNGTTEGSLAATIAGTHREQVSLAVVMGPNDADHPTLVALVDGNDFLNDALSALTHASAPLDLMLDGKMVGHWPHFPAHADEHAGQSWPLTVATLEFTLAFAEVDALTMVRRLAPQPLLMFLGGLLLAALARRWQVPAGGQSVAAEPVPSPPAPPPALGDLHRQRLWQLGELAATLSHDLGQPLNVIRLTAESAQDAAAHGRLDGERLGRTLDNATAQAMRAQDMIDALVAVTRRPAGPPAHLDAVEVVRQVLDEMAPQLEAHGVRLHWHAEPATPAVRGHAPRLAAAVRHLTINAAEALASLPLDAPDRHDRPDRVLSVECRPEKAGGGIVIVVADNGPGFPPALVPLLNDPLAPPPERGKGCGIGLTVVQGVAAEMGGSLRVEDCAPGTRVTLALPAARRSVLVVEDDAAAGRELAEYLESHGWHVTLAPGGHAALPLFERAGADAVVTDLHMAEGDGWSLIARLRALAPDLPVIAISTADGDDARRAVKAGAALVLRKPFSLKELCDEMTGLLDEVL